MPELLLTAVAGALTGGGGLAAGLGLAGAAAGTAGAVTAGASALTILSGAATAIGALGSLWTANSERQAYNLQATQTDLEAGQQQVQSRQRQTDMARQLAQVLGENDVAAAAAGVDIGGGIAASERTLAKQRATTQLSIERQDDDFQRSLLKARANQLRSLGRDAMTAGVLKAAGSFIDFGVDVAKRG